MIYNREDAFELLCRYTKAPAQIMHAKSVEGVMRHFAQLLGQDENYWGIVGLLHDLDYELHPDKHCIAVQEMLLQEGYPAEFIHAVASHGYGICCDVKPEHTMEWVLYTIDELTGLITACAYMRPSRSVMDLELSSLKKKYKDKRFAAGVSRSVIEQGAEQLSMQLDYVLEQSILGMRAIAQDIGL